jgi:serine protease Do
MKPIKPKAVCLLAAAVMASGPSAEARHSPALDLARQLNEAFVEVADEVSPAVVVIDIRQRVKEKQGEGGGSFWDILPPELRKHFQNHGGGGHPQWLEGEGSGLVISPDGYILTNNHVVEGAEDIVVRLKDGRAFVGEVKGTDPDSDIAVVKIDAKGLTPAKLGNSDATRVGEFVLAIGAPFELNDTVTVGTSAPKGGRSSRMPTRILFRPMRKFFPATAAGHW